MAVSEISVCLRMRANDSRGSDYSGVTPLSMNRQIAMCRPQLMLMGRESAPRRVAAYPQLLLAAGGAIYISTLS